MGEAQPSLVLGVLRVFWVDEFPGLFCPKRRYPNDRGFFLSYFGFLGFEFTWGFWFGICIPEWFI